MMDAAKRASARTINLVIPYYGYSRQERKAAPREPISAKLVADLFSAAGATRVVTIDLHAPAIQGFFNIPVDHLTALDLISDNIKRKNLPNPIIVSPDAGRATTAEKMANILDAPFAMMIKKRPEHNESVITHVIGDVAGRTPIIIEDFIDTGTTIVNVVESLKERGALDVYICATHPVFSAQPCSVWITQALKKSLLRTPSRFQRKIHVFPIVQMRSYYYDGGSLSSLFKYGGV